MLVPSQTSARPTATPSSRKSTRPPTAGLLRYILAGPKARAVLLVTESTTVGPKVSFDSSRGLYVVLATLEGWV